MKEYLLKYPDQQTNIDIIVSYVGMKKAEWMCKDAISKGSAIEINNQFSTHLEIGYKKISND